MPSLTDRQLADYMRDAVQMSCDHVVAGGIPFTALVVHPARGVLGSGVNRVVEDNDPTAHAEVVAVRSATAALGGFSLRGCTLLASGEPCALCYMVIHYSGIATLRYAVDRHGAARGGFDYTASYNIFATPTDQWGIDTGPLPIPGGEEPFQRWLTEHAITRARRVNR